VGTSGGLDRYSPTNVVDAAPDCPSVGYAPAAGDAGALWAACLDTHSLWGQLLELRNGRIVSQRETAGFTVAYRDPTGTVWFGGPLALGLLAGVRSRQLRCLNRRADLISRRWPAITAARFGSHSVSTMLTTCEAWTEGATDAGVEAIKRTMEQRPRAAQIVVNATVVDPLAPPGFGTGLALEPVGRVTAQ